MIQMEEEIGNGRVAGAWHTQLTVEPFLLDGGSGQNVVSGVLN